MIDYAEIIKERVPMQRFLDYIGMRTNKAGFICCPFHGEKTASLKIYRDGRGWCCFGCHKGGDVINFAQLWYKADFKAALRQIDADFQLGLFDGDSKRSTCVLSALQAAQRKVAREREERLKNAIEAEYWQTFDKWLSYDRILADYQPKSRDEDFPEKVVEAFNQLPGLLDRLNDLEMRRIQYHEPIRHAEPRSVAVI